MLSACSVKLFSNSYGKQKRFLQMQGQKKRLADPGNILILTFYMEVKYTKEQIFLLFSLTKKSVSDIMSEVR